MNKRTAVGIGIAAGAAALVAKKLFEAAPRSSIAGEAVLITGGSRGLGLALAREFAKQGCRIAICARDTENFKEQWPI